MLIVIAFSCIAVGQSCASEEAPQATQSVLTVCGVNSAYILLRAHWTNVQYEELQRAAGSQTRSMSLFELRTLIAACGVPCAARKYAHYDDLRGRGMPLIAHFRPVGRESESGHYVVVTSARPKEATIIDGTTGLESTMSVAAFRFLWSGYVLEAEHNNREAIYRGAAPICAALIGWVTLVALIRATRRRRM